MRMHCFSQQNALFWQALLKHLQRSLTDCGVISCPAVAKDRTQPPPPPPLSAGALLFLFRFGRPVLLCGWLLHHGRPFGCSCQDAGRESAGVTESKCCREKEKEKKTKKNDTCEVISVHSVEQQEADEEDESEAGDNHSAQRETVAAFSLNDLCANTKVKLQRIKHFPPFSKTRIRLTEPTRTCITISPIPALVTRTDVAHPADTRVLLQLLRLDGC